MRRVNRLDDLRGLDALWAAVLRCPNEAVADAAIPMLLLLYQVRIRPPGLSNQELSKTLCDVGHRGDY